MTADIPDRDGYLVRCSELGFANGKSHEWTGRDTLCRMWATGGLKQAGRWRFFEAPPTDMCHMCKSARERLA